MATNVVVRNTFLSTDIICVRFLGPFVLAGVGGILKVFSLKLNSCVKEFEVFKGHKIYGIQPYDNNHIIIFGCKSVKLFLFSQKQNNVCFTIVTSLILEDWILAAHWLSGGQIVFVTAHNHAWLWDWCDSNSSLQQASCSEKCILYSATVCGDSWSTCVVFAGTVFREVVIWLPGGDLGRDLPVLHRLQGHNGVIFSMTWDWHSSSLCSTSDDRSIRLWNISIPNNCDWKSSQVSCSHVFFGHSARVWKSVMFQNYIVSVGEDCQICIWSAEGKLLQTLERTLSGCQWSLDYSKDHQLLVAGSGDGSLQLIPLLLPLSSPVPLSITYPETLLELVSSSSRVRKLVILVTGCIVVVTEDGTVLTGYPSISDSWKVVLKDDRFRNYCILSVSPDRTRFSLASLKGLVMIFDGDSSESISLILEHQIETGKIWSLLWLSNKEILVCGDEGCMSIWQICQTPNSKLFHKNKFRLPRARERWPTCAKLWIRDQQCFLLCGDRCGSVHLFNVGPSYNEELAAPDHSLSKLHGKLGVTSLSEWGGYIFSTGRDGSVRILGVDKTSRQVSVLSSDKMMFDWVCAILPIEPNLKHFLIIGFKETKMILWSTKEKRTILNFDCGGGHRSWDCIISGDRILEIAYLREKHIFYSLWNLDTLMKPTLLFGISPRELNCVVKVPTLPSSLLFGGEDGTIYLCKLPGNYLSFENKLTLTSHISSVRCISCHGDLFFSAGGRAQLKAWQIKHDNGEDLLCIELASFMLKGEQHSRSTPSIDPEMRFMTLCCIPSSGGQQSVQLVSGCSDGALRWLTFDYPSRKFQIVGESTFHHKCILKLFAVSLRQDQSVLISTATDGTVALWDISPDWSTQLNVTMHPYWSNRIHQSGVNSIHVKEFPAEEGSLILLASGGDDNSVVLSALHIRSKNVTVVDTWSSHSAHAAQVTGVWLIGDWLLSTSIDQRFTVWVVTFHSDPFKLKCDFLHQSIFSVPDIQDMQVWVEKKCLNVCVVGKGVQIISIPFERTTSNTL